MCIFIQNKNEITFVHEPSDHADDTVHDENIEEDEVRSYVGNYVCRY